MRDLSKEAKQHLGIIHVQDVLKVKSQLEVIIKSNPVDCESLCGMSDIEYTQLSQLLQKYYEMLDKITL